MASAGSSLPCEEQLLCSICVHPFSEPVTTPCGHNYCKTCITGYWDSSHQTQCPLCKREFRNRPELMVNTEFRDMVEHFGNMGVMGEEEDTLAKPGEVPCGICLGPKLKAQKTCLVCLASYCRPHLEPHRRFSNLKKHQLVHPVSNLEDRVCKKHNKMFELFCRVEQKCVCLVCLKDDHATHSPVPLEKAFRERKAQLHSVTTEIKIIENAKSRSIKEIQKSVEQSKRELEKEIADITEVFTALVASLLRSQAKLMELIQEKQKAAEKQAGDQVTKLEREAGKLRRRRSKMENLLQTEDHLSLLQGCPSLYSPAHTEDLVDLLSHFTPPFTLEPFDIKPQSHVGTVKKAVAEMEKTLNNEMQMLIQEVRLSDGCVAVGQLDMAKSAMRNEFIREVWSPPQDKLMMIQQCDAVDVTLDAYTANSLLTVSEDGKQLRFLQSRQFLTALFGRKFEFQPLVLGRDGFSSGRFYYEVHVRGSKGWLVGVVKESIKREMFGLPTPELGGWTLLKHTEQFQDVYFTGRHNNLHPLQLRQRPQTVGVFVDYEMGQVSFYDVENRTLIYTYSGCPFIETTSGLKAFVYSVAGTSVHSRPKLYPIFGVFGDESNNVLQITPVTHAT